MLSKPALPIPQKGHPLLEDLDLAIMAYEGAGATARDVSGRGNHGALQGDVAWATGKAGPALDFPGTVSDYVSVSPIITSFPFTLSARFQVSGAGTSRIIYSEADNTETGDYVLIDLLTNSTIRFQVIQGGSIVGRVTSPDAYTSGVHTATGAAYANGDFVLWIDGDLSASSSWSGSVPVSNTAAIGLFRRHIDQSPYDDEISFVQVHNRGLPASEIRRLHSDPYTAFRPVRRWWAVALDVGGLTHPVIGSGVVNSRAIIGGSS